MKAELAIFFAIAYARFFLVSNLPLFKQIGLEVLRLGDAGAYLSF